MIAVQPSPPASFADGVRAATPVILGYLPIGFAFGVLARTAGLTVAEVFLMSVVVYAGASQFIGASMFAAGANPVAIISATFLVNLRHLLMSTALVPSLRQNPAWQNALLAYGITDETFAVNTAILQGRTGAPAFVAGLHLAAQSTWVAVSVVGALAGQMASNTRALGLDFALPAMFIGLLLPNLRGQDQSARLASAGAAALVAVSLAMLFPASGWGTILAALVGATLGAMLK